MGDYTKEDLERDYYLGNYQTCINKATSMPVSRESIYYMCLSYCHVRKWDNLARELEKANSCEFDDGEEEEQDDDKTFVDLIHLFKEDINTVGTNPECISALDIMDAKKVMKPDDELSRLLASAIYARNMEFTKALRVIDRFESLRASHAKITIYIMIHRVDLAQKELAKMVKKDEQSPVTELTTALVCLASRNPTQAWRVALTLADKNRPTPLLNNIQTAAAICLLDFDNAKQLCEVSLDMDNDNLEALINMIHILHKTRAPSSVIERNVQRLRDLYPDHQIVRELESIPAEMAAR